MFLVTNFGIYLKKNADQSQDIFVHSIVTGKPIANATVKLLGLNGLAVDTGVTDLQGHWHSAKHKLANLPHSQQPLVFVITKGHDSSFIPYARYDRKLNYSRFNIGGRQLDPSQANKLDGFLYTDRGLYRPGGKIHIATIIKNQGWWHDSHSMQALDGLPVKLVITDPTAKIVYQDQIKLNQAGYISADWQLPDDATSGEYTIKLLTADSQYQIAFQQFRVADFVPASLKLAVSFNKLDSKGWISTKNLQAIIQLDNLYGTPAAGNSVKAEVTLTPGQITLPGYKDFNFYDPLSSNKQYQHTIDDKRVVHVTDLSGHTTYDLDKLNYSNASYSLNLYV